MQILLYVLSILSYACLGGEGTYVMKVKIYLDQDSMQTIGDFTKHLLHQGVFRTKNIYKIQPKIFYVKKYFGFIFDEINAQLKDSDIQFEADFSDLLNPEYRRMKEKYCIAFSNITNITQTFMSEFKGTNSLNENKILVINCKGNNPFMPTLSHMAHKNQCGKIHGILLTDPYDLRNAIIKGIYKIFGPKTISKEFGINNYLIHTACHYVNTCNRFFPGNGHFVKDLKSVNNNKDLELSEPLKNTIWTFGDILDFEKPLNPNLWKEIGQ